jgi:hypothetical protein
VARTRGDLGIVPLNGPWTVIRLREAALVIAKDAALLAATWSERVPPSVRLLPVTDLGVRGQRVVIAAGGVAAPMAYTNEGKRGGRPIWHPVFAVGARKDWTWRPQTPRPFMRPAAEARAGQAADVFAKAVDDWAKASGFE